MDVLLDDQFQKVETALNLLIESITKYNPSTTAAADLIAADEELTQGLERRKSSPQHTLVWMYSSNIILSSSAPSKPCPHPATPSHGR
jgi:hypothetical protein